MGRFVFCGPLDFLWTAEFFCRPFLWAVFCGIFVVGRAVVGGGPFEAGEFMAGSLLWAVFGGRFRQPPTHKRAGP